MVKAISLFSGGLDSALAVCVIRDQGIDVCAVTFTTPFFSSAKAEKMAQYMNLPLTIIDITEEHLKIVKNPPHGYGKNLNPCIDCHGYMLSVAGKLMEQTGADFIFTGEVLGERPMSQNRLALDIVAKISGFRDYVLRPLSAKHLNPTKPEIEGKVDRERLLDIHGKSRKPQISLAARYGLDKYETPAGGCLLTYTGYCGKLKDLISQQEDAPIRHYHLLKIGRHFRLPAGNKLIVGKDMKGNEQLLGAVCGTDIVLEPLAHQGPVGIMVDAKNNNDIELAAKIIARYCDVKENIPISIKCALLGIDYELTVSALTPDESVKFLL